MDRELATLNLQDKECSARVTQTKASAGYLDDYVKCWKFAARGWS